MNRKALALRAFNTACDRIARDTSLSTSEKRTRYFRLSCAYEARKSQIDLFNFIGFHKLDATLASLAREPVVSRLGSQVVRAA